MDGKRNIIIAIIFSLIVILGVIWFVGRGENIDEMEVTPSIQPVAKASVNLTYDPGVFTKVVSPEVLLYLESDSLDIAVTVDTDQARPADTTNVEGIRSIMVGEQEVEFFVYKNPDIVRKNEILRSAYGEIETPGHRYMVVLHYLGENQFVIAESVLATAVFQ